MRQQETAPSTSRRSAFVISPIGQEGSETREHADDVFDFIIKPAMDECGIEVFRSDHLREPGTISEQMFRSILTADLCIAVLTGYNPNVFYELAVAQASARPVITLIEKGQILPFDIQDLRTVHYDLKPRSLFERVYAKEIVEHVAVLEAMDWKAQSPVQRYVPAGAPRDAADVTFLDRSRAFGDSESWFDLLQDTESVFETMGLSRGSWKRTTGFGQVLAKKAGDGCQVRILLMHPENPALGQMVNPGIDEIDFDTVLHDVESMYGYYQRVAERSPRIQIRRVLRGMPHGQLTRTDKAALYIPYMFSERSSDCPLWIAAEGSTAYRALAKEFDILWQAQDHPSDARAAG